MVLRAGFAFWSNLPRSNCKIQFSSLFQPIGGAGAAKATSVTTFIAFSNFLIEVQVCWKAKIITVIEENISWK